MDLFCSTKVNVKCSIRLPLPRENIQHDVLVKRRPTSGIREYTPTQDQNLNIINTEQQMCLCLSVHQNNQPCVNHGMSLCSWWYTHCTLHVSWEQSGVCSGVQPGPAPSLSRHPVALVLQTGCVYTVLMFGGSNHGTLFLYRASGAKDLISLKYKLNPYRGL